MSVGREICVRKNFDKLGIPSQGLYIIYLSPGSQMTLHSLPLMYKNGTECLIFLEHHIYKIKIVYRE